MFEADDSAGPAPIAGPVPAPAPAPAPGLSGYQVVPDNYAAPLQPGQIKQSDHDELARYGFGKLKVLDDAAIKKQAGKLANDQMSQQQFDQLSKAWLGMASGKGMKLGGDGKDVDAFKAMMSSTMMDSPVMRDLLTEVGSETDPNLTFDVKLGHNQPNVLIDPLASKELDLDDMRDLPSAHDKNLPKNSITRDDQIVHILAERRAAAKLEGAARQANRPPPSDKLVYDFAHPRGQDRQNRYRAERGQAGIKNAVTDRVKNSQTTISEYELDDGTAEYITANAGTISRIRPPGPKIPALARWWQV